jgi:hypothetical protein
MKNKAMFPPSNEELNEFTEVVKALAILDDTCMVGLRDGTFTKVKHLPVDEDEEDSGESFGEIHRNGRWWYADGSSPTNSDFDMIWVDKKLLPKKKGKRKK